MRVLLIDSDSLHCAAIELALKSVGHNVYTTDLGDEGVDLAKIYDYDVIVCERDLIDMSGTEVIRRIRTAKIETPILVVTAYTDIEAKVLAFEIGADDYLVRPYHIDELRARLVALVRRSKGHAESVVVVGDGASELRVNLNLKTVSIGGRGVHVTSKEYTMLECLALRKGMTITKEMFMTALYGGMDEPEIKIIDVFACKLRRKLAVASNGMNYIQTVWGRGYTLCAPQPADKYETSPDTAVRFAPGARVHTQPRGSAPAAA